MRALALLAVIALVSTALAQNGTSYPPIPPVNTKLVNLTTKFNNNIRTLLREFTDNGGLPKSYRDILPTTNESYWGSETYLRIGAIDAFGHPVPLDSIVAIQERTLTHEGLNLYDGATWQIALSLWQLFDVALMYERNILYLSSTGYAQLEPPQNGDKVRVYGIRQGLPNFRANTKDYQYGNKNVSGSALKKVPVPGNLTIYPFNTDTGAIDPPEKMVEGSLFVRMIGPSYWMKDPMVGWLANSWRNPFPNNDPETKFDAVGYIHWNDWKAITGENVWGAIIGPMQRMWLSSNGNLSNVLCGSPERAFICDWKSYNSTPAAIQLAISILPGLEALQSDMGSLYHCPGGSKIYPPDPDESTNVSNENNFSAYAALTMLQEVLRNFTSGTTDQWLSFATTTVDKLVQGLDTWFDNHLIPPESHLPDGTKLIPQGGHVRGTTYDPVGLVDFGGIAVDCQTWGMTVIGGKRVDRLYGDGMAYRIWNATKYYAGYFINHEIAGVGYTSNTSHPTNDIWSAEWSFGAITMAQKLSQEYATTHPDWSAELIKDAASMYHYTTQYWPKGLQYEDGSYVYANARFFIPWGWYANPLPATCSTAWAIMKQQNFNPFVLGGDTLPAIPAHVPGTNKWIYAKNTFADATPHDHSD
jgi:hypothetical protein